MQNESVKDRPQFVPVWPVQTPAPSDYHLSTQLSMAIGPPTFPKHNSLHFKSCHRQNQSRPRLPVPSVGLLSLLASLAGFETTQGSPATTQKPTPFPFLCPFIDQESLDMVPCDPDNCSDRKPSTNRHYKRHYIPDKWELGPDNRWRRASMYTLYGSTLCPVSSLSNYL
jgi:hypothetical protein